MTAARAQIRMADVSAKPATARSALARCEIALRAETLTLLRDGKLPKGDVLATAQVAGILAAKKTSDLIPLCHPIAIDRVELHQMFRDDALIVEAEVTTTAPTGPEMEALTAAAAAALTVYDMCKTVEPGIEIRALYLVRKTGGKSGLWERERCV